MMDSSRALRILNGFAVPLRVRELLWDGNREMNLDANGNELYYSRMNVFARSPDGASAPEETATPEATLFSFLSVSELLYERVAEALGRVGLSYAKYEVLKHLLEAREPVGLGTLAEGQQCARSNITQMIDRLESEGLVRRISDPNDRRAVLAELTPEGSLLAQEGRVQMDVVRAGFAASFAAAERQELGRLLAKLG